MSIRFLLVTLCLTALAAMAALLFYSSQIFEKSLLNLLPPEFATQTVPAIHFLLYEQTAFLSICGTILILFIFLSISAFVVSPVRKMITSIKRFSLEGEKAPLTKSGMALYEIGALQDEFIEFTSNVATTHEKEAEISRVKSDFISTAAHQLRTPLTGIRWALEALQVEPLTAEQKMLVTDAVNKSHDLVAIVGTLLDISSIESGKYKYQFAPVNMVAQLDQIVVDFQPLSQTNNVSLLFAKSGPLPNVRADAERIKWVLNNLIENALRYTPAQGSVQISTASDGQFIHVYVKDTGIGIQDNDKDNIFERFYRAGNAIAKENKGNGLGLYIARTIATDNGGDLTFRANDTGVGTTFTLTLPVA